METGQINVQTENIFPIIKKFLYSDTEIFLRELVSNAVDATQKIKTLSRLGEYQGELGDLKVEVILDKEAKTITIRDYGLGMTAEEIDKYINQIAFSGAEEFVKKYEKKGETDAIIGHFGLGFYSSFMISERVEIISRSHKHKKKAVRWECDGSPAYTIEDTEREWRGTDIVMHVAEDSLEFIEESRLTEILNKYCKFLPVDVEFGTRTETKTIGEGEDATEESTEVPNIINNTQPLWTKAPAGLSDEDYTSFYTELYPFTDKPLFHIHLNVDYPFNLTGILYFPKLKNNFEVQKDKIQLYSNQVFITDSVESIVPDFLTLLHGVIDSPDIPLNVSRSYLQSDSNVKKISNHISKKVADKLEGMFKTDRADFEAKWDDIAVFIQYGMLADDKFYDRINKIALYKNVDGKYFTFEEYAEHIKATQTDKDERLVCLYAQNAEEHHSFIEVAQGRGYDVLLMESPLNPHLISKLEQKHDKTSFARVDADTIDRLIKKDEEVPSKLSEEDETKLKPIFEGVIPAEKFTVSFESMSETDNPIVITESEFTRRMKEQAATSGGSNPFGAFPEMYNMVVNGNHPLVGKILAETDGEKATQLTKQATDLALLSKNMLKGKALTAFINRSIELID